MSDGSELPALESWAVPVAYLAEPVAPGALAIWLDRKIKAAEGLRLGDPDGRSYECIGVDPLQEFPAAGIRLWGRLRMSYAAGEPVSVVRDW